jgi:hypothetical protein
MNLDFNDVDVRGEIEEYEWGHNAKWSEDKLIAASPFRYDRSPSFFIRLEPGGIDEFGKQYKAGTWHDSGAYEDEWRSGNIVKLLSYLRSETYEETLEYLTEKYGRAEGKRRPIKPPRIPKRRRMLTLPQDTIEAAVSPYLTKRGISEEAQVKAGTGRGRHQGYVALPWRTIDGRLGNVKYRATRGKMFFYEDNAEPISNLVWGADSVSPAERCIVCEAEIDALSWRTAGYQAVALGGVGVSDRQIDILLALPVECLVLGGDNDKSGDGFNRRLAKKLIKRKSLALLKWDDVEEKDANDVLRAHGAGTLYLVGYENIISLPRIKKISV